MMNNPTMKLRAIPLGGLGEIGKNCMALQAGHEILLIDCGSTFPDENTPGIDLIIPDLRWLSEHRSQIKALVVTHGHEDHIGAVPFLIKEFPELPILTGGLTAGLIEEKLREHHLTMPTGSKVVKAGDVEMIGRNFKVEFVRVTHSIPDAFALAITTEVGTVVHTGDFKLDPTPVSGQPTDVKRLREIGDKGVLALFADSTNAERPGRTPSEESVGGRILDIVKSAKGRVIIASFASNVSRVQQVITAAVACGRKVGLAGRSMEKIVGIASRLGHITFPEGALTTIDEMKPLPPNRQLLLSTGSQGEPGSALYRLAMGEMRQLQVRPGDLVVFAANPIPGNEAAVAHVVDNLMRRGAEVIYDRSAGVHVSGHASQDEQREMVEMIRPQYFVPVHGEYRMLVMHSRLAQQAGVAGGNVLIGENGSVFEFDGQGAHVVKKLPMSAIYVDGNGVDDVTALVLRDRVQIGQDGIVFAVLGIEDETGLPARDPEIVTRGLMSVSELAGLIPGAKHRCSEAVRDVIAAGEVDEPRVKVAVREALSRYFTERTGRRPLIVPVIYRS